jgi:hypothetical protein
MQMESWSLTTVLRPADLQVCKTQWERLESFGPSVDKVVDSFCYTEKDKMVSGMKERRCVDGNMMV